MAIIRQQVSSDWNATSGVTQILNKPTIQTFDQSLNTTDSPSFNQLIANYITTSFDTGVTLQPDSTIVFKGTSGSLMGGDAGLFGFDTNGSNFVCRKSAGGALRTIYDSGNLTLQTLTNNQFPAYIGSPNVFTQNQTINAGANTSPLTASYSVTGSNTTPMLSLEGTWNTTGIAKAILLNITDTASNASSLLMDLQIAGSSKFVVGKNYARLYGTYTDSSNGRWLSISNTTGGLVTLTSTGNGTGATGNLLKLTQPILLPASSVTLATNGDLAFEATSNTMLTIRYRGSDNTTRSAIITLV
jgi:hypothetical protein